MSNLLRYFDELCDLPAELREPRLAEIAAEDAALAEQLRAMLTADSNATELVSHDIEKQPQLGANLFRKPAPQADFGAFSMLRELGTGGMGTVWLAERKMGSSVQQVAIKFMRHTSPQLLKHFEREREALARLEHPNIARLIDAGEGLGGAPYIACEFVDGQLLLDYIRAQKLGLHGRLKLIEALCEAVDYAHRRLVVHRDIKPSNVMVDYNGRVRLLDFGIAKALDSEPAEHTQNNPLSPAYAAPEQALGQPISTATDVFGLGLLLFEVLTGQLPAQRRSVSASDMAHKINAETIEAPSLTSAAEITELDPVTASRDWRMNLRGDLDLIVLKALKREPERRYASALALADDLRRYREGRTIAARPDTSRYRMQKFIARNRLMVGSASATFLALLAGFSIALWQANVAREQANLARSAAARAKMEVASGKRITEFALSLVHEINPHSRETVTPKTPQQLIAISIQRARTELKDDPAARAAMLTKLGVLQSITGDLASADAAVQEALGIQLLGDDARAIAEARFNLGAIRMQQTKHAEAEKLYLGALPFFVADAQSSDELDGRNLSQKFAAMTQSNLARIARSTGQLSLAITRLQEAKRLFLAVWGAEHPNTIELEGNYGILLVEAGQFANAEKALQRAITDFERIGGLNFPRLLTPLSTLAGLQMVRGQYALARSNFERASAIGLAQMGAHSPYFIRTNLSLVRLLCLIGQTNEARALFDGIDAKDLHQRPDELLELERTRAMLERANRRFSEEHFALQSALRWSKSIGSTPSIARAITLSELAMNAIELSDFCRASNQAKAAEVMFRQLPNALVLDRLALIEAWSVLQTNAGNYKAAVQTLNTTLAALERLTGTDTQEHARLAARLAWIGVQEKASHAGYGKAIEKFACADPTVAQ